MSNEPRKATEVLLELESKINTLTGMIASQGLAMNILSNKINLLMETIDKKLSNQAPVVPKFSVESSTNHTLNHDKKQVQINPDQNIPTETSPTGFRRTSRPETYSGDDSYLKNSSPVILTGVREDSKSAVIQVQKPVAQVQQSVIAPSAKANDLPQNAKPPSSTQNTSENKVAVSQKIINKDGKAIFMADVHISRADNAEKVFSGRTNGAGNWSAVLLPGAYRVVVKKSESRTKEKMENTQMLKIDSDRPVIILNPLTMKP